MIRLFLLSIMLSVSLSQSVNALEIIFGEAVQGGAVLVQDHPDAVMTANDVPLMTTTDGIAIVGFHRDDIDPIIITSTYDGSTKTLTLRPRLREYQEQRIDGLPSKMVTPPDDVIARIKSDRKIVKAARNHASAIDAFSQPFIWPTIGTITGVYGSRRILNGEPRAPHYGIDIAAARGTNVVAPQGGIIRMVEDLYFTGWTIILDHGHGLSSTFLHLDSTNVKTGDQVEKNQIIGKVGSTGRSTGPHLDWRINLFDRRLDPAIFVGAMPDQ